ncbi:MAG: cell envelope integrity EipB family protein [Xanthobacteraceae bacterium]|nr:cell envelope integrity EipB family protein [Xanthobacteraceae bacterium]
MTAPRLRRLVAARVILVAVCLPVTAAIAQTQPADGTPRRMIFNLDFTPAKASDQLRSGRGRMTIELSGSRCTEYKVIRHTVANLQFAGGAIKLVSDMAMTENSNGTQLAFSITDRVNGEVKRQDTLVARKTPQGIVATSRQLPGGRLQLPANVLLPLYHDRLADAAVREKKPLVAPVYNPEDTLSSVERITYRTGAEVKAPLPKGHPAAVMANAPRYRVEILRHDKNGKMRVRENMTRYLNGVFTVSDTMFENMRIKADLASMTLLPQKPCP